MTQLEPKVEDEKGALLDRLQDVSDRQVDNATRKIENYSEGDDENEKRWRKAETRRTFYKIRRWFFWFLFGLLCTVGTIAALGFLSLVGLYIANIVWGTKIENPAALQNLISSVFWTVLVIMATLFGESIFKDHEN